MIEFLEVHQFEENGNARKKNNKVIYTVTLTSCSRVKKSLFLQRYIHLVNRLVNKLPHRISHFFLVVFDRIFIFILLMTRDIFSGKMENAGKNFDIFVQIKSFSRKPVSMSSFCFRKFTGPVFAFGLLTIASWVHFSNGCTSSSKIHGLKNLVAHYFDWRSRHFELDTLLYWKHTKSCTTRLLHYFAKLECKQNEIVRY